MSAARRRGAEEDGPPGDGERPASSTAEASSPSSAAAAAAAAAAGTIEWLDDGEDRLWRLLLSTHARLLALLDEDLRRDHGLNLADYEVLVALSESDGALRMSELAGRVLLSPSGLTRRVDRLVERGLVVRRACPSDGRGSLAALTDQGGEMLRSAAPTHVLGVRRALLDPLGADGAEALMVALRRVDDAAGLPAAAEGSQRSASPATTLDHSRSAPSTTG